MKPEIVVDQTNAIGAWLRRACKERGLHPRDAASLTFVTESSFRRWESGAQEPADRHYPAIIAFLGQEPWEAPLTLAQKLRAERRRRGLSLDRAAAAMGVDEQTYWRWENGRQEPYNLRTKASIEAFLAGRV